jgi:ubiquinone/menaquinone biosynthesis C-methylase UbiE
MQFAGSIPEVYDRILGPLQFTPYAQDLVPRLPLAGAHDVLEVACGTGLVTGPLRAALPQDARLTATDISDGMLAFAQRKIGPTTPAITWQVADMTALPFLSASFDLVVMQFGLMFVPEPLVAIRDARRVLRAGGRYVTSTWQSHAANPAPRILQATIDRLYPVDPPAFFTVPFRLHDQAQLHDWCVTAGFERVTVQAVGLVGQIASARLAAEGFIFGTPASAGILQRDTVPIADVVDAATAALETEFGTGPISIPLRTLLVEAHVPAT